MAKKVELTDRVTTKVSSGQFKKLTARAKREGVSVAEAIRAAIKHYLLYG